MANHSIAQSAGPSSSTSHSLLRRVRDQEPLAWERLVELYTPLFAYWCRRSRLNPQQSEDVIQEVFLAVAEQLNMTNGAVYTARWRVLRRLRQELGDAEQDASFVLTALLL